MIEIKFCRVVKRILALVLIFLVSIPLGGCWSLSSLTAKLSALGNSTEPSPSPTPRASSQSGTSAGSSSKSNTNSASSVHPWTDGGPAVISHYFNNETFIIINKGYYWLLNMNSTSLEEPQLLADLWANAPPVDGVYPWTSYGPTALYMKPDQSLMVINKDYAWIINSDGTWSTQYFGKLSSMWSNITFSPISTSSGLITPWDDHGPTSVSMKPVPTDGSQFQRMIVNKGYFWILQGISQVVNGSLLDSWASAPAVNGIFPWSKYGPQFIWLKNDKTRIVLNPGTNNQMSYWILTNINTGDGGTQWTFNSDNTGSIADESTMLKIVGLIKITSPQTYQVFQRNSSQFASVIVNGTLPYLGDAVRVAVFNASGVQIAAKQISVSSTSFSLSLDVPATGGWYSLIVQGLKDGLETSSGKLDKFGVGEVFVTAGQSNAVDSGPTDMQLDAPLVSTFNPPTGEWQLAQAHMPFTAGAGTAVWGYVGKLISDKLNLPVAILTLGCASTSIVNWQPGTAAVPCGINWEYMVAYDKLKTGVQSMQALGGVRAILWHQGETDAVNGTTSSNYYNYFKIVHDQLNTDVGASVSWFVAKAAYFPDDPNATTCTTSTLKWGYGMTITEAGQQMIWDAGLAYPGPFTDQWIGPNYRAAGSLGSCVHFNSTGISLHANGWYNAVIGQYGW